MKRILDDIWTGCAVAFGAFFMFALGIAPLILMVDYGAEARSFGLMAAGFIGGLIWMCGYAFAIVMFCDRRGWLDYLPGYSDPPPPPGRCR